MSENNRNGGILYSRLANHYDTLFQWVFFPRQRKMIRNIPVRRGARVLDLGVGTGYSLPLYPKHCSVVGVDRSGEMLEQARHRIRLNKIENAELIQMDALHIDKVFPRGHFDLITASFVLSVVHDPVSLLKKMKAVGTTDCSIYILNHLPSTHPVVGRCENLLEPITRRLGWHYSLDVDRIVPEAGLHIVSRKRCFRFDIFTVIHARNGRS